MSARRLLLVVPYFPPKRGGVENYAHRVALGMAAHGWRVTVATSGDGACSAEEVTPEGIRVRRLARWARLSNTPVSAAWWRDLREIIGAVEPHVIDAHTPVPVLADLAVRLAGRIPAVVTYHGDVVKEGTALRLAWRLFDAAVLQGTLRRATRIIATSDLYAGKSRSLRPHREKVEIIPPGVDTARFRPDVAPSSLEAGFRGREVLLFVGQLDRSHSHKGVEELLRAVALVRESRPSVLCVVVGAGDGLDGYRRRAATLGIEGHVRFAGAVEEEDLPRYYRASRAVVLPSRNDTEGFGMVLLEAAASGIPAVGTTVGGIPKALDDGRAGLLVAPRDPVALADAMRLLLSDGELGRRLGEHGRERAVREFSWEIQVEKHLRLFERLCG